MNNVNHSCNNEEETKHIINIQFKLEGGWPFF